MERNLKFQKMEQMDMVVEGVNAARAVRELGKKYEVEMPIVEAIYKVLKGELKANEAVELLMGRARKHESEKEWLY